jgi:hypothetical protein
VSQIATMGPCNEIFAGKVFGVALTQQVLRSCYSRDPTANCDGVAHTQRHTSKAIPPEVPLMRIHSRRQSDTKKPDQGERETPPFQPPGEGGV